MTCARCGTLSENVDSCPKCNNIRYGQSTPPDPVNHPPHYKANGIEAIDVIEAFGLGFNAGNVIKYILRAGRKGDAKEDLAKAMWYLRREIERP